MAAVSLIHEALVACVLLGGLVGGAGHAELVRALAGVVISRIVTIVEPDLEAALTLFCGLVLLVVVGSPSEEGCILSRKTAMPAAGRQLAIVSTYTIRLRNSIPIPTAPLLNSPLVIPACGAVALLMS